MKDPERYLRQLGIRLECPVRKGERAIVDAAHRAFVNHETYFMSTAGALETFLADPLRYCGMLTDPVSGTRFRPVAASPRLDHGGRPYFLSSEATRAAFVKDPARYATPTRSMPASAPSPAPGPSSSSAPAKPPAPGRTPR